MAFGKKKAMDAVVASFTGEGEDEGAPKSKPKAKSKEAPALDAFGMAADALMSALKSGDRKGFRAALKEALVALEDDEPEDEEMDLVEFDDVEDDEDY